MIINTVGGGSSSGESKPFFIFATYNSSGNSAGYTLSSNSSHFTSGSAQGTFSSSYEVPDYYYTKSTRYYDGARSIFTTSFLTNQNRYAYNGESTEDAYWVNTCTTASSSSYSMSFTNLFCSMDYDGDIKLDLKFRDERSSDRDPPKYDLEKVITVSLHKGTQTLTVPFTGDEIASIAKYCCKGVCTDSQMSSIPLTYIYAYIQNIQAV